MAVVGKFSLNGFGGKLVMRNFGATRAVEITFDLGGDDKAAQAAKELLGKAEALRNEGGVTEVFPLQTPEAQYVIVAGDVGLSAPDSAEMTVDRAKQVIEALRERALPQLRVTGDLESYTGV